MTGEVLLDTNVVIALLEREPQAVEHFQGELEVSISVITVGATARRYGTIKNELRRKGRPIPENDIWIAATAIEHALVLVTRDDHFRETDGLEIEAW